MGDDIDKEDISNTLQHSLCFHLKVQYKEGEF